MRSVFDPEAIVPDVPGVLLLSHGGFAVGCLETIKMLAGDVPNLAAFSLEEGMEPSEFIDAAMMALEAFPVGSIVLLDLLGGTPYNQTLLYVRAHGSKVYSLAGFNVPMVMQALELRDDYRGRELVDNLFNLNNNGIYNVSELSDTLMERMK